MHVTNCRYMYNREERSRKRLSDDQITMLITHAMHVHAHPRTLSTSTRIVTKEHADSELHVCKHQDRTNEIKL